MGHGCTPMIGLIVTDPHVAPHHALQLPTRPMIAAETTSASGRFREISGDPGADRVESPRRRTSRKATLQLTKSPVRPRALRDYNYSPRCAPLTSKTQRAGKILVRDATLHARHGFFTAPALRARVRGQRRLTLSESKDDFSRIDM